MRFAVAVEYDRETDSFSAVCPDLPGCASAGDSEQEARENLAEAIALFLDEPAI